MLKAFVDAKDSAISGADLTRAAGIASGTMYPLLIRFEAAKILKSAWESSRPEDMRRPRRRLYQLTEKGSTFAQKALRSVN